MSWRRDDVFYALAGDGSRCWDALLCRVPDLRRSSIPVGEWHYNGGDGTRGEK
jgi:hypothetical protein